MQTLAIKVGEIAKRTGLTVRTLHFYEELGLLIPSERTEAGHRLYSAEDVMRLQQIKSMRQMGFSLDDIKNCLSSKEFSPRRVVQLHLKRVDEQLEMLQTLKRRLAALDSRLDSIREVSIDEFLQTIEVMSMMEHNFSTEEMEEIKARGQQLGDEKIREVETEWPTLIAAVKAAMDNGTAPDSAEVQGYMKRWKELVMMFSGGNPAIEQKLKQRYESDSELQNFTGIDPKLMDYVGKAMSAGK
ncbi:MAG: MerR family transcriptional regulator [Chloroflexi bacterium]|nr:MerR family transcriptional regulator [Chloroflexota bacterium]